MFIFFFLFFWQSKLYSLFIDKRSSVKTAYIRRHFTSLVYIHTLALPIVAARKQPNRISALNSISPLYIYTSMYYNLKLPVIQSAKLPHRTEIKSKSIFAIFLPRRRVRDNLNSVWSVMRRRPVAACVVYICNIISECDHVRCFGSCNVLYIRLHVYYFYLTCK